MRLRHAVVLLLTLFAASGCSTLDRLNDALYETGAFDLEPSAGRAVAKPCDLLVLAGGRRGRGVIVGPRTVLTVAHVVGDEREVEVASSGLSWSRARVVRRIASRPEPLVELEVATGDGLFDFSGFEPERRATLGGGDPAYVVTANGVHGWARGIRPGDSGSPVINARGEVVGLLVGVAGGGRGVLASTSAVVPPAPSFDLASR